MSIEITGDDFLENKVIKEFSPEEIEEIRKNDPDATICRVAFNKVKRVLPMNEVKQALSTIRSIFEAARKENPERSDDEIRQDIRSKSETAETMASNSHPKLFHAITSRKSTDEDFRMIMFNIHIREQVEEGKLSEEEAMARLYAELIRKKEEEEKANKK